MALKVQPSPLLLCVAGPRILGKGRGASHSTVELKEVFWPRSKALGLTGSGCDPW